MSFCILPTPSLKPSGVAKTPTPRVISVSLCCVNTIS